MIVVTDTSVILNLCLLLSKRLTQHLSHEEVKSSFEAYEKKPLQLPEDAIPPDPVFLAEHRAVFYAA